MPSSIDLVYTEIPSIELNLSFAQFCVVLSYWTIYFFNSHFRSSCLTSLKWFLPIAVFLPSGFELMKPEQRGVFESLKLILIYLRVASWYCIITFKFSTYVWLLTLSFVPFIQTLRFCDPHRYNPKVLMKYWSKVVRNPVRSFEEIQLTMFEKYSKHRSDPDSWWRTESRSREAIAYSSRLSVWIWFFILKLHILVVFISYIV